MIERMEETNSIRRLLVVHTWGIGDWLFFSPVLQALKERFPTSTVDLILGTPGTLAVAKLDSNISNTFVFDVRKRPWSIVSIAWRLRWKTYDALIFTAGIDSRKADFVSPLFRSRRKIALKTGEFRHFFLTATERCDRDIHMVENNRKLLKSLGITADLAAVEPRLHLPQPNRSGSYLGDVLIHPGCDQVNAYRRWPVERFVEVTRQLLAEGVRVSVILGPDEEDLATAFSVSDPRFHLYKGLPLFEVYDLIRRHRIFLNSDSGLGHIAAALDRPTVTVAGPMDTRATRPYSHKAKLVRSSLRLGCQPCVHSSRPGCAERPCLLSIDADTVAAAVFEVMNKYHPGWDLSSRRKGDEQR